MAQAACSIHRADTVKSIFRKNNELPEIPALVWRDEQLFRL